MDRTEIKPLFDMRVNLGEGPTWDEVEQALYFVDINARKLFRYDTRSGNLRDWTMPEPIGCFGLRKAGGAIVALRSSAHLLEFATGKLTPFADMPDERKHPANRMNDGRVAPDGRFWVGSVDTRPQREPVAAMYRIDADGTCTKAFGDLYCANGLAFSPDGRTMYHADTVVNLVKAYDYDTRTGALSNPRPFHTFDAVEGRPDGATMDAEGHYWVAGPHAGRVNRLSPAGKVVSWIDMPAKYVTMPCFGGPDMKTLYVTSIDRKEADDPQGGATFVLRVEVPGIPEPRFAG